MFSTSAKRLLLNLVDGFLRLFLRLGLRRRCRLQLKHVAHHVAGKLLQGGIVEQQGRIDRLPDRTGLRGWQNSTPVSESNPNSFKRPARIGQIPVVDGQHARSLLLQVRHGQSAVVRQA